MKEGHKKPRRMKDANRTWSRDVWAHFVVYTIRVRSNGEYHYIRRIFPERFERYVIAWTLRSMRKDMAVYIAEKENQGSFE
jgi:hypothetical protein